MRAVALLPEHRAEPHGRTDEDEVVELVEVPLVEQELVEPGMRSASCFGVSGERM
jgi:hypothetical protein